MPGHPPIDILKATQQSQQRAVPVQSDADWGVLDGVHVGATWRIRLNHPCAAAIGPYVKLL